MNTLSTTKKLTISGLCLAMYIVIMMMTQGFAFGQYQVRIATALYGLAALFPFSVLAFGIGNLVSNLLMGGLGPIDAIGGCLVGLMTAGGIAYAKKRGVGNWIVIPFITLVPSLVVPLWLAPILNLPYGLLVSSLLVGQSISAVVSFFIVNGLDRYAGTMLGVVQSKQQPVEAAETAADDEETVLDVNEASKV